MKISIPRPFLSWLLAASLLTLSTFCRASFGDSFEREEGFEEARSEWPQSPQAERGFRRGGGVYKDRITPHWQPGSARFWYRNALRGGAKEFIAVDAEKGTRQPAFDHEKLATALSRAASAEYMADRLPFDSIQFSDDQKTLYFKVEDAGWKCDLGSYECVKAEVPTAPSENTNERNDRPAQRGRGESQNEGGNGDSPDGKWNAFIKDGNVFVRAKSDGAETQLSNDGGESLAYSRAVWAPDSKHLVSFRVERGERKEVYLVQSSPPDGGRAKLRTRPYPLPGDKFTTYELSVFDPAAGKQIKPEVDKLEHEWERPRLRWSVDGRRFAYEMIDRGHQRLRIVEVDSHTGAARNLVDEKTDTFIWTAHTENVALRRVNWLEKSDEFIYASERDGWRHLYLIDAPSGKIQQITKGEYVVRGIDRIDEEKRQIWFTASGKNPDQDPYLTHYYRVDFDGSNLVALTDGNGNHTVQYSPDRAWLIATYSRVDAPPVSELRRVSDGKLVCKLEEADISELKEGDYAFPEVFVAKGRDGKTDIWGIISRSKNFDPAKKYPVIEDIYAGPQSSFVPKTFSSTRRYATLTDLGFVVVKIDGMGTANRSKAFHDVCWKNLKDGGFQDRILWMKAAAAKFPYMDLTRVGVYGTSAGGQNAAGAALFHPEFYKVAVANCGCHDNRMDKASWNEQWMGYPVGPQYSECSNIDNAAKLQGRLFLIVGEMDSNVPPESTYRFADALIRAKKDFDYLVVPNADHGARGASGGYVQQRMNDFFVRHLLGENPPNRNAETQTAGN